MTGPLAATAVQSVNPVQRPDWDSLAGAHANSSIFHGAAWARVLADTYGYAPVYLRADEAGSGCSLLPLMEVNSWLTGRRGISLPFTDDCQPLAADGAAARRLLQTAFDLGKSRRWKSVEFRGGREWFPDAPASLSFYGHDLELEGGEGRLFARLESSVRRAIRKAEKSGVTATASPELEAMTMFYSLQCKTRRKHGLPPQPFAFFRNIHRHILSQNLGTVVAAWFQDRPIAASVFFQWGTRAVFKYGASDPAFQHLRGSNLVMWEAVKRLARDGARTLNLGRTSPGNEGLRQFKLGWGAGERKIEYFKYNLRRDAFVVETDHAAGWHNRLFRALPPAVSRLTGRWLYRHVA